MRKNHAHGQGGYGAWLTAINHSHYRRIGVHAMNLEHKRPVDLSARFHSGSVAINTKAEVSRILTLTLWDPHQTIRWEPTDPDSSTPHLSRMVSVDYRVAGHGLTGWVDCPTFTGPVFDMDRAGPLVTITGYGKEWLALGEYGKRRTFQRKMKVTHVIRELMRDSGETDEWMRIPDLKHTLPERLTLNRMDKVWVEVKKLARSIGYVIFYDGAGVLQMRRRTRSAAITIDRNWLASDVAIDRQPAEWYNRWIVIGAKPRGHKKRIKVDLKLRKKSSLAAGRIGRNGKPRWRIKQTEDSKIKNRERALEIARKDRDDQAVMVAQTSFETLPLPNAEEYDMVRVRDRLLGSMKHRVETVTIPLGGDGAPTQSWGILQRLEGGRRRRRGPKNHPATHGGLRSAA